MHGAYYDVNGFKVNKLEDPQFLDILTTHDILCLQETHCGQNDLLSSHINLFHPVPHCRKISNNNRYFGGMLLLIRKTIRKGVRVTSTENPDILGIRLLKDFFGLTEDLHIWFVYCPPLDSPYLADRKGILDCLDKLLTHSDRSMVFGDLNGKTSTEDDFVMDMDDGHSPINDIDGYQVDTPPDKRNNVDTKKTDKQGKRILEICQSHSLRILNGRTSGDRWGQLTRFPASTRETPSTLDYGLCHSKLLGSVKTFQVNPITDLSDHCCITCKVTTLHRAEEASDQQTSVRKIEKKYKFDLELGEAYKNNLENNPIFAEIQRDLNRLTENPTQAQVDEVANRFGNGIICTAVKTFPLKPAHRKKIPKTSRKPAKWFNTECSKLRKQHRRALAKFRKNPYDTHLRENACHTRKLYKTACKNAEAKLRQVVVHKLLELSESDPKEFWRTLKTMREWGREKPDPSESIPADTWQTYYKSLLNKASAKPLEAPPGRHDPILDSPLQFKELTEVIHKAKWGKAHGTDLVQMELIKLAPESTLKVLFCIMQVVFRSAVFPRGWTSNFLKAIYKKDSADDPDNYRGLAIAPAISKLYCMILLHRLETYMVENKILSPNQIGFQRGYRTSDHIYLLKTLVTKVLRKKKKVYAAFIDFKKAYDTVDRSILLKSLHNNGVQGPLLKNLKAMYENVSYAIKLSNGVMDPIASNLGLKQGCPLSPLLFNIYINDLGTYLKDNGPGNLNVNGTNVNHFLYADDLVLLAESREKLQEHLDGLNKFAKAKELTVNTKKSVVMVFNNGGRKTTETFTYDNRQLSTVQSFTYLGIDISAKGSFTSGVKALVSKAKKAMIPLFRTIVQFELPFSNIMKMFTSLIEPILLYNAENWAAMTPKEIEKCKRDHNRIYEKSTSSPPTVSQLKYLKFALGVSRQVPSMAILGETAEVPLILKGYHRMLTYWNRTRQMEDHTLVKKAYLDNVSSNSDWCQTIQILNCSQDLHNGHIEDAKFAYEARKRIRENFIKYWRERIDDRTREKKLHTYSQVKQDFKVDEYLTLPKFRDRQRITKFLTSNHCLQIEKGRHNHSESLREDRICKACDLGVTEDEDHFLLRCTGYESIRQALVEQPIEQDYTVGQFFQTYSPSDITNYLKTALTTRDKLVNFHVTHVSLCGMRMTIGRGSDKQTAKVSTRLQSTITDNQKLRISRKGTRHSPY